ncbi:MAG: alpha/beta hydrolase [Flavobacteriia bacterium]|nr:MAG: alpha/beta hydrolase [Flavobacteriia bacterium]
MRILLLTILIFLSFQIKAQKEEDLVLETKTGNINGSLLIPENQKDLPVALIIAGSGPTDRNGNNPYMKNNSLKMLAEGLAKEGIASLRYDKRGIATSKEAGIKEEDLRFENYVQDAEEWIKRLKKDKRFKEVIVIGHSEGSLIGMIASKKAGADKYVSIAGAGMPAGDVVREQLKNQPAIVTDAALPILDSLEQGKTVKDVPPMLAGLFRMSVQPYIISWFKYDPRKEIAKLDIPVLIVQGTTDIQVSLKDAENLKKANPKAELKVIEGMNHIFKEAEADRMKNMQTYSQPDLPLHKDLVKVISGFIKRKD